MPTVEASKKDLEKLIGRKLQRKQFEEMAEYAKSEIEGWSGDKVIIEVKDTNRPDLLSAEGISREIRSRISRDKGIPKYTIRKSNVSVIVDKSVQSIRPCIAAAIVKEVKFTEDSLVQMIQLQEKVCMTFGRKRKEAAIGLYDWNKLKQPMHYTAYKPREKKFIPLDYNAEMHLEDILVEHPKGKEYGQLLLGFSHYPIFEDKDGLVASMPPIINSQITGKVSKKTRELLVEVTGYKQETVNTALNVMVSALADRGFEIYSTKIKYPNKTIVTPNLTPKSISVPVEEVKKVLGLPINNEQIVELLHKARYNVKIKVKDLLCQYPAYRQDILHPIDVIEDVAISYGYNKIEPEPIRIATIGSELEKERLKRNVEEACIGLGLQEVLTYTLTNKEIQSTMMGLNKEKQEFAEIANPVSAKWEIFRKSLLPNVLEFLSKNQHAAFPQKVFETGKSVEIDAKSETGVREPTKLCMAVCGEKTNFTEIKSCFDAIAKNMGWQYKAIAAKEPFYSEGRAAKITGEKINGHLGEISKQVLKNFGIETAVTAVEIEY